jgi:hypothetical protein
MTQPGLFDIAPPGEKVNIGGIEHEVRGLPLRVVAQLVKDYPAFLGLFSGGGLTAEAIIAQGPRAVALIIACGYGMPDDEKALAAAANVPLDVQIDLIAGIVKATLGGGALPFAEKINRLYEVLKPPEAAEAPATEVQEDSEIVRARKLERMRQRLSRMQSPPTSNSSSSTDTAPAKFGT